MGLFSYTLDQIVGPGAVVKKSSVYQSWDTVSFIRANN